MTSAPTPGCSSPVGLSRDIRTAIFSFVAMSGVLMQPHQVVGIIDGDLSDAGAAGVRQVGVTVVDGESAET